MIKEAQKALTKYWGYPDFRPDQKKVVRAVMAKADTLALLPTGGGKSICYQVPGLVLEGMVIVISPLIALMNDQVENLKKRNISAVAISSSMRFRDVDIALENAVHGKYKFLYVSPERVNSDFFQERLKGMHISFFAIDEAHCISQWGFDFRPSYLKLAQLRELKPNTPILALTASAPTKVVQDIETTLKLKTPTFIQGNFIRENLSYYFIKTNNKANRIKQALSKINQSSIVYTFTRKDAREFAQWLQSEGLSADFYHGGMTFEDREKARLAWMNNTKKIMCATNAFGMGIDKPDVKVVLHQGLPLTIEAYYQEAGRAGRDGKNAWAILLYNDSDLEDLEKRLALSFPPLPVIKHVYKALTNFYLLPPGTGAGKAFKFEISEFCKRYTLKPITVFSSIKFLEKEGYIALTDAARTPSRIMVTTNQKHLYSISVSEKVLGKTIEILLRSYSGLFDDFQTVNETLLAQRTQQNRKDIVRHFKQLHKMDVLVYREQTETPWLIFTEDAVSEQNLRISPENYHHLKELAHNRLNAFLDLINSTTQCRNTMLLAYFGITVEKDCGICDICISKRKAAFTEDRFDAIHTKIKKLVKKGLSHQEIMDAFASNERTDAMNLMTFLIDNDMV